MKKKIAFLAPETKGGPYFVYKDLVEGLKEKYGKELDIYFFNSKLDWIKLHFQKYDFIFSVIPFLFKPVGAKKYIFNPRGNFEIEKKKNNLGNKLLYFAKNNLKFSDKIMLTSYYLADKLNFRKKFQDKIFILPNFIDEKKYAFGEKIFDDKNFKILTITSFKFFDKGRGILNLGNVVKKIGEKTLLKNKSKKIFWTIIGNDNSENFLKIKKDFDKIIFPNNVEIIWKGWIEKEKILEELKDNDYFLYWTYLDNFPNIILEAIASNMKVLVNSFESFGYFLDEKIICKNESEMVEKVCSNNIFFEDVGKFGKNIISEMVYNFIKNDNEKI